MEESAFLMNKFNDSIHKLSCFGYKIIDAMLIDKSIIKQ